MSKSSSKKYLQTLDIKAKTSKGTKQSLKRNCNPSEGSMSPEFRKKYLEEIIKYSEDIIKKAKYELAQCQRYLAEAENASSNLTQKISLINSLKRTPSERALKQVEFLTDFLPKYKEKMGNEYKKSSMALTISLDFYNDEIKKYQDELNSLNSELQDSKSSK